ncbi:hypothetical protein [Brevibacillus fulvus]|uniref:Uncharacterized protein n=1 Tax=Brevibacillus fulvus TaxID=1125967 RepID=A0A939BUR0_9BACL|nr:hypothetical protein [Brevibacillus fulvus]MBM7590704.1 hypothetical protein [Brevibacillus fulvus]
MTKISAASLQEKKREIKQVINEMEKLPNEDNINVIRKLLGYLNQLLRMKTVTPPTSEIMILLANQKPVLYHAARLAIHPTSHLFLLFQIKGDYQLAEERLEVFFHPQAD